MRKIFITIITIVLSSSLIACGHEETSEKMYIAEHVIIFVRDLARKSEDYVNAKLGAPSLSEEGNWTVLLTQEKLPYKLNYYKENKVEIMFIDGVANRLRVNLTSEEFFKDNRDMNLLYIGLAQTELFASKNDKQTFFINDYAGFYLVETAQRQGTKEGTVLVVTEEKYK